MPGSEGGGGTTMPTGGGGGGGGTTAGAALALTASNAGATAALTATEGGGNANKLSMESWSVTDAIRCRGGGAFEATAAAEALPMISPSDSLPVLAAAGRVAAPSLSIHALKSFGGMPVGTESGSGDPSRTL